MQDSLVVNAANAELDREFREAQLAARPTDDQDRVLIEALTDREIAAETLTYLRLFTDMLTQMSQNPMISRMFPMPPGFGGK